MNINIVRGGIPLFTRDVSVGGNQFTDALQKELDLSYEDAERLKKGETLPSVTDEQKQQILRSVSDILTLEIQKTFDFFRATASGENIQRIVVAGGTARVPAWSICCAKSLRCRWKNSIRSEKCWSTRASTATTRFAKWLRGLPSRWAWR